MSTLRSETSLARVAPWWREVFQPACLRWAEAVAEGTAG